MINSQPKFPLFDTPENIPCCQCRSIASPRIGLMNFTLGTTFLHRAGSDYRLSVIVTCRYCRTNYQSHELCPNIKYTHNWIFSDVFTSKIFAPGKNITIHMLNRTKGIKIIKRKNYSQKKLIPTKFDGKKYNRNNK